jgi:hypothetical protein
MARKEGEKKGKEETNISVLLRRCSRSGGRVGRAGSSPLLLRARSRTARRRCRCRTVPPCCCCSGRRLFRVRVFDPLTISLLDHARIEVGGAVDTVKVAEEATGVAEGSSFGIAPPERSVLRWRGERWFSTGREQCRGREGNVRKASIRNLLLNRKADYSSEDGRI